jgi:hypothetical protein
MRATNCDEMRGEVAANACACAFACSIATTCGAGWLPSRCCSPTTPPHRRVRVCMWRGVLCTKRNCAAYVTAFSHRRDEEATLFPDQQWADTTPRGCTHPAHVHHLPFQRGAEARAGAQRTHTHHNPCHECSLQSIVDLDKGTMIVCVCVGLMNNSSCPHGPTTPKQTPPQSHICSSYPAQTMTTQSAACMAVSSPPPSGREGVRERVCVSGELFSQVNFLLSLR